MAAIRTDEIRDRIAAYAFPRGGVEVVRASRGYTLYSRRTDGPVARLRPTGDGEGSGDVVARNRLGCSRRLRPRHHADQPSSRIYRHGKLLLDQCLTSTTSQNVQSPAKTSMFLFVQDCISSLEFLVRPHGIFIGGRLSAPLAVVKVLKTLDLRCAQAATAIAGGSVERTGPDFRR